VSNPLAIGVLIRVKAFALAVGEANKALVSAFFTDKTCREGQQIVDLYREHGTTAGVAAQFLADEAPGLPMLRHAGARQHRDPGKQGEVTS